MYLVIVESPTKAKTLGRFLGPEYRVEASLGHVRDLPENRIGVKVEAGFEPEYTQTEKQKERMRQLAKFSDEAQRVYLAMDPDREGEAIAWHVATLLSARQDKGGGKRKSEESNGGVGEKFRRIEFHEITRSAVERALENGREIDSRLVDAQQARRVLDRLVGYKLSPLLWRKVRRGLSAGRVQSAALRLVVEREQEREAFKPEEYWEIGVWLEALGPESRAAGFWARLTQKDGKKILVTNAEQAGLICEELRGREYRVSEAEKKQFRRTPPPPFTTATLQQAAANKLGWSAKRTMQVAQGLYEEGLITYHRTDSTNVADEAVVAAGRWVKEQFGGEYALEEPRRYKTKQKTAQEAHEAIRPTEVEKVSDAVGGMLREHGRWQKQNFSSREQERLYDLIWKRFVATQMAEVRGESVKISVAAESPTASGQYVLEAKGEMVTFDGWGRLYPRAGEDDGGEGSKPDQDASDQEGGEKAAAQQTLPELREGERLRGGEIKSEQKFTQPPARYNDASLIKKLEELGIGRPSTYAPILSTIQERQYVEKVDRRFRPTAIGRAVNEFLVNNFAEIVDYKFTAKMEEELDEIAEGERDWREVMSQFYGPFSKRLDETGEAAARVKIEVEATGEKCPGCGEGEVVVRTGRFGKFLSCSRYPDCQYKAQYQNKTGIKCPTCGEGEVVSRRTKMGRTFFGCSRYPQCNFVSWNRPAEGGS